MSNKKTEGQTFATAKAAAANFAKEKTKRHRKPTDHLEYDVMQAEALGYGCHYGNYKADHPNTREEFENLTGMKKVEKVDDGKVELHCLQCGATFYVSYLQKNKKYCCDECRQKAQHERAIGRGPAIYCAWCGREIPRGTHRTTYCCNDCLRAADRERSRKRQGGQTNGNP